MRSRAAPRCVGVLGLWLGGDRRRALRPAGGRATTSSPRRAERQQQRVIELDPPRGTILDARGRELAVSVEVESAFAVPREIARRRRRTAAALARATATRPRRELERQLVGDREFVWVARKLDPPQAPAVRDLELPGIDFLEESKRYYPMRELAAQVLGYVGTDDRGLVGLEAHVREGGRRRAGRRTGAARRPAAWSCRPSLPSASRCPAATCT